MSFNWKKKFSEKKVDTKDLYLNSGRSDTDHKTTVTAAKIQFDKDRNEFEPVKLTKKNIVSNYSIDPGRSVSVLNTSTKILDRNEKRISAILVNDSTQAIYLKFGSNAVLNSGIRLNASGGSIILGIATDIPYTGEVYGIASTTSTITIIEINLER